MPSIKDAKNRLDRIINIGRVDLYKPIQIAEVLYHSRIGDVEIDINMLETYRSQSKHWRDIVCQSIAKSVIENLLSQTSWFSRVKGIVTEEELINWYERCLRGQYATILARTLLDRLSNEFKKEFPQAATIVDFLEERHYLKLEPPERWVINLLQDLQNATEVE